MSDKDETVEVAIPVQVGSPNANGDKWPPEVMEKAVVEATLPMPIHRDKKLVAQLTKLYGEGGELRAEVQVLTRPEDPDDLMRLFRQGKVDMTMRSVLTPRGMEIESVGLVEKK